MYGIDYIIPNISYLENKADWIKGAIITHGHMDHIGGIPHIIGKIGNPPMFTGKLTAGLIRKRCEEHRACPNLNISEIDENSTAQLGKSFRVEFLRVNHSIPDSFAVIIHTPIGTVIHTGDFKIDYSPVNDKPADLNRIAQLGGQGVLLMMSDSTDSNHPGYQVSESSIGDEMDRIFEKISGRIIIGTFASQLSRIQKLFDLARKHNRKIYLQGRSMNNNVDIAHKIGYLKFNTRILIRDADLKQLPDEKIMILGTGAQGESNAFLVRVVTGEHRTVSLKKGDTVVFSSSVIPGNERSIQNLKDQVVRQGAHVIHYQMMDVHAGGHAKQEDLKLMMRLLKPKFFIPIEGNHYMLRTHAGLAEQVGIPIKNIFVPDNGQVVELAIAKNQTKIDDKFSFGTIKAKDTKTGKTVFINGELTKEKVITDYVMVDGLGVGDVSNIVLRDRRVMAEDGMIVVIATIDSKTGNTIGNPDIISRGFVYMKENRELIEKTRMKVKNLVCGHGSVSKADDDLIKNKIRNEVGKFLFSKTKRRPMVLPVVIKV
ncbi:ribonuclease J, partial [Candidatus Parcubacteria bacterium]|nr:ribonuclease J [Candidatus Parcubacteria bacterium]